MASVIDIIINARWRGDRATDRAEKSLREMNNTAASSSKELKGVGSESKKTGRSITSLATTVGAVAAAFGGAFLAARQLFRTLEEGAGIELTTRRFANLANELGRTEQTLRVDLLQATDGMLSSTQAMALATDLLALNLATNSDEAVRLARIVTELDQDLNQLTQAMANQSTRRLDQLGVSVVTFREKMEALGDTMSDEDAYRIAFIQAAEEQIDRVGGVSESSAGDVRRLQAAMAEADEQFKLAFTRDVSERIGEIGDESELATRKMGILGTELGERIVPAAINASRIAFPGLIDVLQDLNRELERRAFAEAERGLSDAALAAAEYEDNLRKIRSDGAPVIEEQIDLAEELDKTWRQVSRSIVRASDELEKVSRFETLREGRDPGGADLGQLAAEQRQEELDADFQLRSDRIELWQDFQEDLTDITEREQARRMDVEAAFEERRTEAIEEFNRRRARQDEELARDIDDVREDSQERRAEIQADGAKRLEKVEEDHARRRQEIIEDAAGKIEDAASRLDAGAVSRIERQRDRALDKEQQQYEEQRQDIIETVQERLQEEREAEAERIADLREHHAERQALELEQHERELEALEEQKEKRLKQIKDQAEEERRERERQWTKRRTQLGQNWNTLLVLEQDKWNDLLDQEEMFWRQRIGLIPEGTGTSGTGGTGTDGGSDGANRPDTEELYRIAVGHMQSAGWSPEAIYQQTRVFRSWSDSQIARWIERQFGVDIPGYLHGILDVPRTGLALLHEGEMVIDAQRAEALRTGNGIPPQVGTIRNSQMGDINIHINGAREPRDTAREVRREIERMFERAA